MIRSVRRVALGHRATEHKAEGAALSTAPTSAQACDPSHPNFCIAPAYVVGAARANDVHTALW
jgi:hypothetical protein